MYSSATGSFTRRHKVFQIRQTSQKLGAMGAVILMYFQYQRMQLIQDRLVNMNTVLSSNMNVCTGHKLHAT